MSELKTVADLFTRSLFRVPDYQRGYSWGEKQLQQFWEDLLALDLARIPYHYTGTMMVAPVPAATVAASSFRGAASLLAEGYRPYYIIDGQQRVVTILILCRLILDRFADNEIIHGFTRKDLDGRLRLVQAGGRSVCVLGYDNDRSSDDYVTVEILGDGTLPPSADDTLYTVNLRRAKSFFGQQVADLSMDGLRDLMGKILVALKFHVYEVDDEIDASLRFETINNRGKSLSTLELLKNRLIYLATLLSEPDPVKSRLRSRINDAWKTIFTYLGKNRSGPLDEEDFLLNHWRMYAPHDGDGKMDVGEELLHRHFVASRVLGHTYEFQAAAERLVMPMSKICSRQVYGLAHTLFRERSDGVLAECIRTVRHLKDAEINRVLHVGSRRSVG